MSEALSRRPPNLKANRLIGGLVGLLAAALFLFCWWSFALPKLQQQVFGMYAKSEIMVKLPHSKRIPNPWPQRHQFLKKVFDDQSVPDMLLVPASVAIGLVFTCFLCGIILDKRHLQQLREGKKMRGPNLLTPEQFNRKVKGDGYAFPISQSKS